MIDLIKNQIEVCRTKSADLLISQQKVYIPRLEKDQIEYIMPKYIIDGQAYLVPQFTQLCIKLKYIHIFSTTIDTIEKYYGKLYNIKTLVQNKIIKPFMLFVNGVFIPWEIINIGLDHNNQFILIKIIEGFDNFIEQIKDPKYVQTISLPEYFEYGSKYDGNTQISSTLQLYPLIFSKDGLYAQSDTTFWFKNNSGDKLSVISKYFVNSNGISQNITTTFPKKDMRWSEANCILFSDGKLASGEISRVEFLKEEVDSAQTALFDFDIITPNPIIKVTSNVLQIFNIGKGRHRCLISYPSNYDKIIDNEINIDENYVESIIKNNDESNQQVFSRLDLKPDNDISKSINTILEYNHLLFKDIFKVKSKIDVDCNVVEPDMRYLRYHLHHDIMEDEKILLFINGELYSKSFNTIYNRNIATITILYDKDIISSELMKFYHVNNNTYSIIINKGDNIGNYDQNIFNENVVLFSTEEHSKNFDFSTKKYQNFLIEYHIEHDGTVILHDEFYYGKPLTMAYKNRFVHHTISITEDIEKRDFALDLADKFRYCYDRLRFNVFINGRKIDQDYYRLVLPNNPNTPFIDEKLYIRIPLCKGDLIDVVYTPIVLDEFKIIPDVPLNGNINLGSEYMKSMFNKDLCFIWINGKKIPKSDILDINSNNIKIINNENSIHNLTISQYIPEVNEIINWPDVDSLWNSITNKPEEDLFNMLGTNPGNILTNLEKNINSGAYSVRSVMNELIRDQYILSMRADITKSFIFDYYDESILDNENDDNIINTANANRHESIEIVSKRYEEDI